MNCRDRDLVETTIFRVVETEICRDWPKIVEIEIFPRLSLISGVEKNQKDNKKKNKKNQYEVKTELKSIRVKDFNIFFYLFLYQRLK